MSGGITRVAHVLVGKPATSLTVWDLYMSLYAFHLGQIISTVLGHAEHGGQDGNAART